MTKIIIALSGEEDGELVFDAWYLALGIWYSVFGICDERAHLDKASNQPQVPNTEYQMLATVPGNFPGTCGITSTCRTLHGDGAEGGAQAPAQM